MIGLEPTLFAVDTDILRVVESAATFRYRVIQHVMNRRHQPFAGGEIESCGESIVSQSSPVQYLVGVDIADACDAMLVE